MIEGMIILVNIGAFISAGSATAWLPGTGSLIVQQPAITTLTVASWDGTVAEGK